MNVLSLFSGIGGLDLGLERAGMKIVGQTEIDQFCLSILAKHWPDIPRHDDVRTCADWWLSEARPTVDLICGGFPCQPVSSAGMRRVQDDPRWLWPAMADVIGKLRPPVVLAENVIGLRARGLEYVVNDLKDLGYAVTVGQISACALGAPHTRSRLFILADASGAGWQPHLQPQEKGSMAGGEQAGLPELLRSGWWEAEPRMDRVADGISPRLDNARLRALGNAVVPQVAEYVGRLISRANSSRDQYATMESND
jgi:DNA (cytosine-5)-methyltransferase 1